MADLSNVNVKDETTVADTIEDVVEVGNSETSELLSNDIDDFIETPNTKTEFKKIKQKKDVNNICIKYLDKDDEASKSLGECLFNLCSSRQTRTPTYNITVNALLPGKKNLLFIGFCDSLTADKILYLACVDTGAKCICYRHYGTKMQREITADDLGKRPFRF